MRRAMQVYFFHNISFQSEFLNVSPFTQSMTALGKLNIVRSAGVVTHWRVRERVSQIRGA
jgi:hypothetical protein